MVKPRLDELKKGVESSTVMIDLIEQDLVILKEDLDMFDAEQAEKQAAALLAEEEENSEEQPLGRGRRNIVAPLRFQQDDDDDEEEEDDNDGVVQDENDLRKEKVDMIELQKNELSAAKDDLAEAKADLSEFESLYDNVLTEEDFIKYAKERVKPVFDKYKSLFSEDASLVRAKKAFLACELFDILHLRSGPSNESLNRLIDDLVHFEFPEFDSDFICQLKSELPELLELANNMAYNFDGEDAAKEKKLFHERVKERARRERQRATLSQVDAYLRQKEGKDGDGSGDDDDTEFDPDEVPFAGVEEAVSAAAGDGESNEESDFRYLQWKQDVGERSRRIYDWWRVVMNEKKSSIPTFQEAVRIIATVQVSSAAVERVFSQLTFIRRAVGDATCRDVMETRAFVRCNGKLTDDFTANRV